MRRVLILVFLWGISFSGYSQKMSDSIQGKFCIEYSKDSTSFTAGLRDVEGLKTGDWVDYSGNRCVRISSWKEGQLNGNMRFFNDQGVLLKEIMFSDGRIHGDAKFYSMKGELLAIYGYVYDKLTYFKYYVLSDESPPYNKTFVPEY